MVGDSKIIGGGKVTRESDDEDYGFELGLVGEEEAENNEFDDDEDEDDDMGNSGDHEMSRDHSDQVRRSTK